jgi:hypothetical protein
MSKLNTPADALPLLAYKIAPRQFDLSYRFSNISLRDQVVRAQTLVRTLISTGLLSRTPDETGNHFQLLICGAGAAGLAVAKEAQALGITFVLIEKGKEVPGGVLCKDAQRYVSTAMYEWPHPNHTQHNFPLSDPSLLGTDARPLPSLNLRFDEPTLIKDFGKQIASQLGPSIRKWKRNFTSFQSGAHPDTRALLITQVKLSDQTKKDLKRMLNAKTSIHGVTLNKNFLPRIALDSTSGATFSEEFQFEYVIYAVGFAEEAVNYAKDKAAYKNFKHTPFWEKDQIFEKRLGFVHKRPHVGILGSGDGALQDALRCLVKEDYPHPLAIWDGLMKHKHRRRKSLLYSPHVHKAMAKLAAADCYTTGGAIWSHQTHMFESLDEAFNTIADDLIDSEREKLQAAVDSMMRDDVRLVTIVTQYGYFSKAYALNRFLVILFNKLFLTSTKINKVKLNIISGDVMEFEEIPGNNRGAQMKIARPSAATVKISCDVVIIRGGLDNTKSPQQLVGLSGKDTGRAGLGRIPAPIRPVSHKLEQ